MTKTIKLTANTEVIEELIGDGCHVRVENRGDGIVYASKYPDVVAGADNVMAIASGDTKILTDVCTYSIEDGLRSYRGDIYLLADSDTSVEITTTNVPFSVSRKGGVSNNVVFTEDKNLVEIVDNNINTIISTYEMEE